MIPSRPMTLVVVCYKLTCGNISGEVHIGYRRGDDVRLFTVTDILHVFGNT